MCSCRVLSSCARPRAPPPQLNESSNEVLTSVKESLKKVLERRGNLVLSEILIHKFPSAAFHLEKGKLADKNLHSFLILVSKSGKVRNNNKTRSQKKNNDTSQCSLVSGAKTDTDLSKVEIGKLQCSETWEIFSVKSNHVLENVVLDVVADEHHHTEKAFIVNAEEAKSILQGLDIHFLLNVLQNAMLQLSLSREEAQVVQALRICRNCLVHSEHVPQLEKLLQVARILEAALSELEQPSQKEEIRREISVILKRLDSNNLIEELQRELVLNSPQQRFLERHFTLPSGRDGPLQEVCEAVCRHQEVRVQGEVCSGRTCVLLALYQMWAQQVGPLAVHYRLLLPLLQRPGHSVGPPLCENVTPDDLVLHFLRQWAPGVMLDYGESAVVAAVREVQGNALALCDHALGYDCGPHWTQGPRVLTDWPQGTSVRSSGDGHYSAPHAKVVLLPLKSEQVKDEVWKWQPQPSTVWVLYEQFQDQQLLTCPQALNVFRNVTSKVVRNLDLEMMRELVDLSHNWTSSSDPVGDKEFFFKVAFDNILSNKENIHDVNNRCVPSYLVGPRKGPYKFRSLCVEEYCAAMFVSRHASSASWKWLRQPVRFQRVFTFVLQIWNEEGTLQDHETAILNYLSVILGLYRLKGRSKAQKNQQWQAERPADWTLEKEGFIREGNPKCKLWLFVFHVYESVIGDLWAVERVLRHLLQYNIWLLDVERFNDRVCEDFNRLCRKTVSILLRSKNDGVVTDVRLPTMKVSDKCRYELLERRELLLRTLACFQELCLPLQVKVHQYYNCRDGKYGRAPLTEVVSKGAQVLYDSPVPITSYVGPLVLDNCSLQECALTRVRELRLTVYSLCTVHSLLQSCPSCLRLLSLNVLSHFSGLPSVAVLKLHGLYPPHLPAAGEDLPAAGEHLSGPPPPAGGVLTVRCLMVKFVHGCGEKRRPEEVQTWCSRLLSSLTSICPDIQRLIVSRAPASWTLTSMYHQ
ncbi:hypothetical protein FHG87_020812, partial [Trinorchestia longiramus]